MVTVERFPSVKNLGFGKNEVHFSVAPALRPLAILFLLVFSFLAAAVDAQLYTGSVTGVVTDPSGAAVPRAKVTLVDQDKGFAFTATTDSTGRYLLRSIPPLRCSARFELHVLDGQIPVGV